MTPPRYSARLKVSQKATLAKAHKPAISRFFRKQGLMVLDRLELIQHQFTNKAAPLPSGLYDSWTRIWGDISQDTFNELQDIIGTAEKDGLQNGGDFGTKTLINPGGKFWDLKNPRAVAWFQKNGGSVDYIKGINDTTSNLIKGVIGRGLDRGQSYNEIARGIRSEFDGMTRERSIAIATYETGNAYEAGNRQFADSIVADGVEMEKMWQTSEDEKDCDICDGNEAEGWIPIDQAHQSGDQEPCAHVNCRCYEIYRQAGSNA